MSDNDTGKDRIPSPVDDPGSVDEDFDNRHGHLNVTNPEAYLRLVELRDHSPRKYREYLKSEKDRFLRMHRFLKDSDKGPRELLEYHGLVNLFNSDRRGYAMKIKTRPDLVNPFYGDDANDVIMEVFGEHAGERKEVERVQHQISPKQREVQKRTRTTQTVEVIAVIIFGIIVLAGSHMVLTSVDTHMSGIIHGIIIAMTVQLSVSRIRNADKNTPIIDQFRSYRGIER